MLTSTILVNVNKMVLIVYYLFNRSKPHAKKINKMLAITSSNHKTISPIIIHYYNAMSGRESTYLHAPRIYYIVNSKWAWGQERQAAFDKNKQIMAKERMIHFPDHIKGLDVHIDSSDCHLIGGASQGKRLFTCY